jgi:hypothetical protein
MAAHGPMIFENDAALSFLKTLQESKPTAVGDLISAALRAVAQAEGPLEVDDVQEALAAVALLLAEYDETILDGAPDAAAVAAWFTGLEIELNPARRQIAEGALTRILLPADNEWYELWNSAQGGEAAIASVVRLQQELAGIGGLG